MTPVHPAPAGFDNWSGLLDLILRAFAPMTGRIDPPSSALTLTPAALADRARREHLYLAGGASLAGCAFFAEQADALYIGKLAIDPAYQRQGLGRAFIGAAHDLARARGLPRLRLETRIELTENHAAFRALGFCRTAGKRHPGFDRITSITMERALASPLPAPISLP